MTDYAIKGNLSLTAKGKRWLLSKLPKGDPLRVRLIDDLNAAGEPLHVEGEHRCMERGHDIRTCDAPKCRARHRKALKGIIKRYEMCGNEEKAREYRERLRNR